MSNVQISSQIGSV